jgi:hypothetical protein
MDGKHEAANIPELPTHPFPSSEFLFLDPIEDKQAQHPNNRGGRATYPNSHFRAGV